MINKAYQGALSLGIAPYDFWSLSIIELEDWTSAINQQTRSRLYELQAQANIIINGVSLLLSNKNGDKLITMHDLFPSLFEENKQEKIKRDLAINKAKMDAFMLRMNKKKGGDQVANGNNRTITSQD